MSHTRTHTQSISEPNTPGIHSLTLTPPSHNSADVMSSRGLALRSLVVVSPATTSTAAPLQPVALCQYAYAHRLQTPGRVYLSRAVRLSLGKRSPCVLCVSTRCSACTPPPTTCSPRPSQGLAVGDHVHVEPLRQTPRVAARVTLAPSASGIQLEPAACEVAAALAWQLLDGLPLCEVRSLLAPPATAAANGHVFLYLSSCRPFLMPRVSPHPYPPPRPLPPPQGQELTLPWRGEGLALRVQRAIPVSSSDDAVADSLAALSLTGKGTDAFLALTAATAVVVERSSGSSRRANRDPGPSTPSGYAAVGGLEAQLAQVKEVIELPLRDPGRFTRLGIQPPRGLLLVGPPGTDKDGKGVEYAVWWFMAAVQLGSFTCRHGQDADCARGSSRVRRACRGHWGRRGRQQSLRRDRIPPQGSLCRGASGRWRGLEPGQSVPDGPQWLDGQAPAALISFAPPSPVASQAEARAPSLIFIDEIDALCPRRDLSASELEKRIVAVMLTLMDGTAAAAHSGKGGGATAHDTVLSCRVHKGKAPPFPRPSQALLSSWRRPTGRTRSTLRCGGPGDLIVRWRLAFPRRRSGGTSSASCWRPCRTAWTGQTLTLSRMRRMAMWAPTWPPSAGCGGVGGASAWHPALLFWFLCRSRAAVAHRCSGGGARGHGADRGAERHGSRVAAADTRGSS